MVPCAESSLAGRTGLTLPVIVETSTLSSELVLTNWSASKKSLRFAFVAEGIQTQGSSANFVIELNAREQMILSKLRAMAEAARACQAWGPPMSLTWVRCMSPSKEATWMESFSERAPPAGPVGPL